MDSHLTKKQSNRDRDSLTPLLQAVLNNASDIYILMSADLNILAMNHMAERLYKWKISEVLNRNFQELCLAQGYDFLLTPDSLAAARQQKVVHISSFDLGFNEAKQKIQWKLSAVKNSDQTYVYLWVGTLIHKPGITADDVNNIWLSMPGILFWKDREGVYLGATNRTAMSMGFRKAEEVMGKTDHDLFAKQEADVMAAHDKEIMDTNMPKIFEEIFTLQGKKRILSSEKIPLRNSHNEVIGIVGNSIDITHLKELESELRQARELAEAQKKTAVAYFEHFVENMPGSMYWKNREGVYIGCNRLLIQMLNLKSQQDIVGKTDYDLWPEQAESLRANDLQVMQTGQAINLEENVLLPNGERHYYKVVKMPLKDSQDNIVGIIGNSLDITDLTRITEELRQAKESAEVANKAKSDFLSVVSHELRIPLTHILGMSYYLGSEPNALSTQQKEYLENTSSSANHLLTLVNDLLDFAKMEVGKFEFAPAPLNLRSLLEETMPMFMQQAREKDLELLLNCTQNVPNKIFGDSRALRQIMINLLGNAIKFTEKGHISIQIDFLNTALAPEQNCLELIVTDTGIGIPEEKFDLIFERFRQADSSLVRKYAGTGLGLTITKTLVELMGGTIEVNSVLGQGSTFKCLIPSPLQDNEVIEQPWLAYQSNVRILIIDDSPRGDILRQQISPTNCQVIQSKEALNTFIAFQQGNNPYQVVIINSPLSKGDPFALAEAINNTRGLLKPMLILLSTKGAFNQRNLAKKSCFFDCIVAPVQPIEFQSSLTAAWEKWVEQSEILLKQSSAQSLRVLLVEDMPMILMLHSKMLADLGCVVETAVSGSLAIDKMMKENYDMVFMDMGLSDISGDEVTQSYRESEQIGKHLPIIALTAYGTYEYQKKFLKSGFDEILVKPVTKEQLSTVLQRYRKYPNSIPS